jgi:hypothetical protein
LLDLTSQHTQAALAYGAAGYARDLVRCLLRDNPQMTGQEILVAVEADFRAKLEAADADKTVEIGICKRCNQDVIRQLGGSFLIHADSDGYPTRVGCRAASFTPGNGWNDSLDRKWKATWSSPTARI